LYSFYRNVNQSGAITYGTKEAYSRLLNKYLTLGFALKISAFYTILSTLPVSYWIFRGNEIYNTKSIPQIKNADIIYATGLICGVYCVAKAVSDFKFEYRWIKNMSVGATTNNKKSSNPIIKILEMGNATVIHELTHAMSNGQASPLNHYLPNSCACFFTLYYLGANDVIAEIGNKGTKNTGSELFLRNDWHWNELTFIPDPKEAYAQAFDVTVRNLNCENYGVQDLISGSIIEMHRQGYPKEIVWEYLKDIEEQGIENTETNENLLAKHQKKAKEKFLKLPN
jgi:hypothetical protein